LAPSASTDTAPLHGRSLLSMFLRPSSLLAVLLTTLLPLLAALHGGHHHHHPHHRRGDLAHAPAVATVGGDSEITIRLFDSSPAVTEANLVEAEANSRDANESAALANQSTAVSAAQSNMVLRRSESHSHLTLKLLVSELDKQGRAPGVMLALGLILLAGLFGGGFASLAMRFADAREKAAEAVKREASMASANEPMEATNAHRAPGSPILPPLPAKPHLWKVMFYVVGHCVSASMLTVANKKALVKFHPPAVAGASENASYLWTLVVIQFICAALVSFVAGGIGLCSVTPLQLRKALAYFPAAAMFMVTIIAGNAVMNFANVNAFLVLRSLVPLPCTLAETWLYKDSRPPLLSAIALLVTVGGAVGYGMSIGGIQLQSIAWAVIYLVCMPVDALLIKHSISSLDITPWGLVLYNNVLAAIPALFFAVMFEVPDLQSFWTMVEVLTTKEARAAVLLSCGLGISISYFQLRTRYFISATAFMVLGVFNKFATVLVNKMSNEPAEFLTILCVLITISGAIIWQLSVRGNSIRVREGNMMMEKTIVFPFAVACAVLGWAGYIEWRQVSGVN